LKLDVARLDSLFAALRGVGLVVGVEEMARCRQVLASWGRDGERGTGGPAGELSADRWRSLLARVLVKKPEQGAEFDRVFELWANTAVSERPAPRQKVPPPPRFRKSFAGLLAVVVFLAWLSPRLEPRPWPVEPWQERPPRLKTGEKAPEPPAAPAMGPRAQPKLWLKVLPPAPVAPWPGWPELMLGLFLLVVVAKRAHDIEAQSLLPPSGLPPRVEGPTRVLLSPPAVDLSILEPEERESIVWGVGRFVSEEKTARIDLAATVRATAGAGGRIELRYVPRSWHREIWLWLDEAAADPRLRRVADEVEQALSRHGLPVERAFFRGAPEVLYSADGRRFRPREIEDRRDVAQVAILTDGRLIGRRLEGLERQPLEAIFRELGGWPRLALFLPESAADEVRELAGRHQIEVRRPAELATFLSASRRNGGQEGPDLELWAAACALSPSPVDEGSAEALRRLPALKIDASPWQIEELRTQAGAEAVMEGRLEWRGEERRRRVEWLRGVELGEVRIFDRALAFWLGRYEIELARRAKDAAFAGTLAEAQLRAERALLRLLERGESAAGRRAQAIDELFQLHQGVPALKEYLEKKLAELDTTEGPPGRLRLDFSWAALSAVQQHQLSRMRFAGRELKTRLRKPRRSAAFLALGCGLAGGTLFLSLFRAGAGVPGTGVEVVGQFRDLAVLRDGADGLSSVELELGEDRFSWRVVDGARVEIGLRGPRTVVDEWGVEMVALPGGKFWLGRRDDDPDDPERAYPREFGQGLFADEQPAHEVTLDSFSIDRYEVTHEQYRRFVPEHQSTWDRQLGREGAARLPVTDVDQRQAADFCAARGGRLPTEAEWEYSARAGTRTPWAFGGDEVLLEEYAWSEKNSKSQPQPVGTRKANPWGLHDMHGNVWEWTATDFGDYGPEPVTNPLAATSVLRPVVRGGSYGFGSWGLRSAYRDRFLPGDRNWYLGFRCVRVSRPELGPSSSRPISSPDSDFSPGSNRPDSLKSGADAPKPP
jgi:formylglycine-generating enzyme required for sulfatase activity